jgi:hypothetical protein
MMETDRDPETLCTISFSCNTYEPSMTKAECLRNIEYQIHLDVWHTRSFVDGGRSLQNIAYIAILMCDTYKEP